MSSMNVAQIPSFISSLFLQREISYKSLLSPRGILKRYPEISDRPKKVLSNPPEGSFEPLQRFYRIPKGHIEPLFGLQKSSIEPL